MYLTPEQTAILQGAKGDTWPKVMKTLVMYGEIFGADKMVPVTSRYNHLVTSFGLKALGPVYDLMNRLIESGAVSTQKFSADPAARSERARQLPAKPGLSQIYVQQAGLL